MVNKWKVTAIIFIVLFSILLVFNIWAVVYTFSEEEAYNDCYYNVCGVSYDAWYENGICTCYGYDELGEYGVVKMEYKK